MKHLSIKLRKLLVISVIVAAVSLLLNILIDNPYTHQFVRILINKSLNDKTDFTVDFKALKLSAVPPAVDAFGFSVDSKTFPGRSVARASHIRATLSLWSLLLGEPKIGSLNLTDADVNLPHPALEASKAGDEAQESAPFTWPPDFRLPIENIIVTNGRVFYTKTDKTDINQIVNPAFSMALGGIDVHLAIDRWSSMQLYADISSISISADGSNYLDQARLRGAFYINDTEIKSENLNIKTEDLETNGSLSAKVIRNRKGFFERLKLNHQSTLDGDLRFLDKLLELPGTEGAVEGNIELDLTVPLIDDQNPTWKLSGQAQVNDAIVSDFRLGQSRFSFTLDDKSMEFSNIDIIMNNFLMGTGSGTLDFNDSGNYSFKLIPDGMPFTSLLGALTVDFSAFDANLYSDNLTIAGTTEPFAMNVTANAEFHQLTFPQLQYDKSVFPQQPSCRIQLNMFINSNLIDYQGTSGTCFQYSSPKQKPSPEHASQKLTDEHLFASPVIFSGYTTFEDKKGMNLRIHSPEMDAKLVRHFTQFQTQGKIALNTRIHGSYDRIIISNQLKSNDLKVMETDLPKLEANIQVDDDRLLLDDVEISFEKNGFLSLTNAEMTLNEQSDVDATINAKDVPAIFINSLLNESLNIVDLDASIKNLRAQLKGSLYRPFEMVTEVVAEVNNVRLEKELILDAARLQAKQGSDGWLIDNTAVRIGSIQLGIVATQSNNLTELDPVSIHSSLLDLGFDSQREWSIKATSQDPALGAPRAIELSQGLKRLPYIGKTLAEQKFDSGLALTLNVSGAIHGLQGSFSGSLKHLSILGCATAPLNFDGFIGSQNLELILNQGGNALAGKMIIDYSKEAMPFDLRLNLSRYDIRPVTSSYFFEDPRNYAYATGKLNLIGSFSQWWKSTGLIQLDELTAQFHQDILGAEKRVSANLAKPFTMNISEKGWNLQSDQSVSIMSDAFQLTIDTKNNKPPEKLGIEFSGEVDAALSMLLSPQIETASGKISVEGSITGNLESPKLKIDILDVKNSQNDAEWAPLSIGIAEVRPAFKQINLDLSITKDFLRLNSLKSEKGNGILTSSGILYFSAQRQDESRIDVNLKNTNIIYPLPVLKSLNATISGDVALTGTSFPLSISGDLQIDRANSTGQFDLRKEIFEALRKRSYSARVGPEDPAILFDINLVANQSINISNRSINAIISTNLRLAGTDVTPNLRGQVEINEGTFTYKQEFKITQGMITFDDPVRPDPKLDILAESEVNTYRINFGFSGRASNPIVDLSIDPPTRDDGGEITKLDILSLLSKGSLPPSRTNFADTGGVATAEVINILAGQFEEPVEKLLDMTGQSIVRQGYIDTKAADNGQPVPRFNVPLNLGPDWDMIVRVEPDNWQMSSEYNLHDNILIQGSVDGRDENETAKSQTNAPTDTGIDLKFRFSYP